MIRIFADFNALSQGRLPLSFRGSIRDIEEQGLRLQEGMRILVYDDQCQAQATVVRVGDAWYAEIAPGTEKTGPS